MVDLEYLLDDLKKKRSRFLLLEKQQGREKFEQEDGSLNVYGAGINSKCKVLKIVGGPQNLKCN